MSTNSKLNHAAAAISRSPLLTIQDLMQHYGVCERTIYYWWASGKLPAPIKPGGGKTPLWQALDILRHDCRQQD